MLQFGMSRYVMRAKEELLCSSSFTLITTGRIRDIQIATYSIRTLLKMDYCIPKHVELLNVMNKINHQICILLDYRYNCAILQSHNVSELQFSVFLTGINRLLVTSNGQSAFPSANPCQGQL